MKKLKAILLIDDDSIFAWLTKSLLEEMGAAERIECFSDAPTALDYLQKLATTKERLEKYCPDLILLDISMPGMSGFDFLDNLQQLESSPFVYKRIVALSTSMFPEHAQRILGYGIHGFLGKPMTETKARQIIKSFQSAGPESVGWWILKKKRGSSTSFLPGANDPHYLIVR